MSKDDPGKSTKSSTRAKVELRRALPAYLDGGTYVVDTVDRSGAVAVFLRVSPTLIAQSRRVGGIAHSLGAFDLDDSTLGFIELRGDDEVHYLLFDPAEGVMRDIIDDCERSGSFLRLFLSIEGDARLSTLPDGDMMCEVIRNAARSLRCETMRFAAAHFALAEQLRRAQAQCKLAEAKTPQVFLHTFLTDTRFAEAEQLAAGTESYVVIH